jgi:dienelactone hydrolase
VKTTIQQAQQMPHALPGKVALVGFSLGGGMCLYYGTQWPDLVTGAVVWYPAQPPSFTMCPEPRRAC